MISPNNVVKWIIALLHFIILDSVLFCNIISHHVNHHGVLDDAFQIGYFSFFVYVV